MECVFKYISRSRLINVRCEASKLYLPPVESVELSLGGEDLGLLGLLGEDLLLELLRELVQVDLQRLALLVELGELLLRLVAADQSLLHFLRGSE